jgi:hypothetical protein
MLVDTIIDNIKLKGGFPTDNYFTDAEMLTILNDEMKLTITPLVMKLREEFFVQEKQYTITSGGSYRIPKRCIGNKLRDVKLLVDTNYRNINRLFEEDRESEPTGYYITKNTITLSDDISTGTLAVSYYLSPSTLVLSTACAQVLTIDSATQITVSSLPATILTTTLVDLVEADSPNDLLAIDQTITNISGTTLTFASLPSDLAVGDYVCLAGQSPIPTLPEEVHPLLTQAALVSCLRSKKDSGAEDEYKLLKINMEALLDMLDTRVDSNDIKLNGQGLLSYIRSR